MSVETHLFVIWDKGRFAEKRILEDMRQRFEVVFSGEMRFPGVAKEDYCRFYNTRRFNVRKKVSRCGAGPFLFVIVKVRDSEHVVDQYGKTVNALMYKTKDMYREWCGGKFRVHGTLQTSEYERDVYRITGHTAAEWEQGTPSELHMELPPYDSLPKPLGGENLIARLLRHLGLRKKVKA